MEISLFFGSASFSNGLPALLLGHPLLPPLQEVVVI